VPDSTVAAVERCLAKDPARRWPDARSLKLALGVPEEPHLPDTVRAVEGQGVLFAILAALGALALKGAAGGTLRLGILGAFLVQVVIVYVYATFRMRREGVSIGETQRVIWREPSWWPFWYARNFRRRGNVWDRLPARVRRARALPLVIFGYSFLLTMGLTVFWDYVSWRMFSATFHLGLMAFEVLGLGSLLVLWPVLISRAQRALEHQGLDRADARRVVFTVPPSRVSFWARPHIAAVLAPTPRPEAGGRAETPYDQLQSILRHGQDLSGPLRPLGAQAAMAARQLLASIDQADRDAAELARNLEPGEEDRLRDKIAALAAPAGRDDESVPLRALLEKQLELVRGLAGRIEEARATRNRRAEMLKTLSLHLASLRARSVQAPADVGSLSDRVRALCDDIERQAQPPAAATAAGIDERATLDHPPSGGRRP
jgi:hypothetical protein